MLSIIQCGEATGLLVHYPLMVFSLSSEHISHLLFKDSQTTLMLLLLPNLASFPPRPFASRKEAAERFLSHLLS